MKIEIESNASSTALLVSSSISKASCLVEDDTVTLCSEGSSASSSGSLCYGGSLSPRSIFDNDQILLQTTTTTTTMSSSYQQKQRRIFDQYWEKVGENRAFNPIDSESSASSSFPATPQTSKAVHDPLSSHRFSISPLSPSSSGSVPRRQIFAMYQSPSDTKILAEIMALSLPILPVLRTTLSDSSILEQQAKIPRRPSAAAGLPRASCLRKQHQNPSPSTNRSSNNHCSSFKSTVSFNTEVTVVQYQVPIEENANINHDGWTNYFS